MESKRFVGDYATGLNLYKQMGEGAKRVIFKQDSGLLEDCALDIHLTRWGIKRENVGDLEGLKQAKIAQYLPKLKTYIEAIKKGDFVDAVANILSYVRYMRGEAQDQYGRWSEFADYTGLIPAKLSEQQAKAGAMMTNLAKYKKDTGSEDLEERVAD